MLTDEQREEIDRQRRDIHALLAKIQQDYQRHIDPLIKQLVFLDSIDPSPIRVSLAQAQALGLLDPSLKRLPEVPSVR